MICAAVLALGACGNHPIQAQEPGSAGRPVASVTVKADGAKAYELLKAQTAMGPRFPGGPAHEKCRSWIVAEAKKYTDKVVEQPFSHTWSTTGMPVKMTNVIATMDVGSPRTALLIAHWDTRPTADQEDDEGARTKPIPGANDGASGVAVLLDLMRAFKEEAPSINVVFLFVDGEDLGPGLDEMFLGATYYAKHLTGTKPNFGILLDMIGDKDLSVPKEEISGQRAGDIQNRFYKNAELHGLGKAFPNYSQGAVYDDHLALNDGGIPTIDLIDFTYDPWHTLRDTDDKCSAQSLQTVGTAVETFIRAEKSK